MSTSPVVVLKDDPALEPYLGTKQLVPENQESPIHFVGSGLTPTEHMYRRSHFAYPKVTSANFAVQVSGRVAKPFTFTRDDLLNLPRHCHHTVDMVMECSGNKRSKFARKAYGVQWNDGAVSFVRWTGVRLAQLLGFAQLQPDVKEIVFGARDSTEFQRSLPIAKALHPDTLIAFALNGQVIPLQHGFPLRLIVPGWYAVASVKWLKRITALPGQEPFRGRFQTEDYVIKSFPDSPLQFARPTTVLNVNSVIQSPLDYEQLNGSQQVVRGVAWSGHGPIVAVMASIDDGKTWFRTRLKTRPRPKPQPEQSPCGWGWTPWQFAWTVQSSGNYRILVSAVDSMGNFQPAQPLENALGYGYNAQSEAHVKVKVG